MISLQTPYFTVHSDTAGFVVRLQRSGLDYPDIPTLERDMDAIIAVLDRLGRERRSLCIDWREGPMRNDTPFEDAIRRVLPRLMRSYKAVAVLVRSAVGVLQAKRHLRETNSPGEVYMDEADAFDFLRGLSGAMSRRPTPIPSMDRSSQTNARGEKVSTSQLPAVERVPGTMGSRSDRHSSLPPMPGDRPSSVGASRDRQSSVPPLPADRFSQVSSAEDRPSSLPLPPPSRAPRS